MDSSQLTNGTENGCNLAALLAAAATTTAVAEDAGLATAVPFLALVALRAVLADFIFLGDSLSVLVSCCKPAGFSSGMRKKLDLN